jgi:solute:Na+ symporter, SSS family
LWNALIGRPTFYTGSATVLFAKNVLTTTFVTTAVWILATVCTAPEPNSILLSFYRKVRPDVTGWKTIAALAPEISVTHDLGRNLWCWILGTVMVYSALFGVGKLLLQKWPLGICLTTLAAFCAWQMSRELSHGHGSPERAD